MTINITNGDCINLMKDLQDKSIDLLICDLPYGETNCKWDCKIDMEQFWKEFKRIRKSKRTACIHFCSTKFGYELIKSWEKGFKMDMVWKKRNKTGGLQSKNRPMRNHEMVYFFYEEAPKYNRDKYHKRIQDKKDHNVEKAGGVYGTKSSKRRENEICFAPPNPASVLEEETTYGISKDKCLESRKNGFGNNGFEPPNPASVLEEDNNIYGFSKKSIKNNKAICNNYFEPPNPASVLEEEETDIYGYYKDSESVYGLNKIKNTHGTNNFEPPNPASVLEEKDDKWIKEVGKNGHGWDKHKPEYGNGFEPPNPASVLEEDEPVSMFESTKVFIGKRHHQTEKPLDILEFFLKYYSDEGNTILDPTMGSGSTGVACKKLNRNFIGFELDEKIFKVAEDRLKK